MAESKTKTPERVPLFIPLDPNGETREVFLCVNGRNMLVRTGEQVDVPPEFAEAYHNSQQQLMAALRKQAELEKKTE